MKYHCALIWPRRVLRLWQMWLDTNMHISPSGWSSCCWSPALIGWLEQRRYEALSDTANTAIVPLLHLLIGQGLSGNHKIIMAMVPLMMHLYMLQYVTAWINGCGDELNSIQSDKKKNSYMLTLFHFLEGCFLEIDRPDQQTPTRCPRRCVLKWFQSIRVSLWHAQMLHYQITCV